MDAANGHRACLGPEVICYNQDWVVLEGDAIVSLYSYLCTAGHDVDHANMADCDFLYVDGIFVNEQYINKVVRKWIGGKYARWKVRCGWLPLHPTCYIKREVMMKCGLYDESYKIAADTNLLVHYLYNCHLKVAYLPEFVTRMRMGGMSTGFCQAQENVG